MRLLIVEDNDADARLVIYSLRGVIADRDIDVVMTRMQLHNALRREGATYDCVILDYWLPGLGWPESMHMAREVFPDIPVIVISGALPEDRGRDALAAGADDYVDKDHLQYLPHAIRREIVKRESRVSRSAIASKLREVATDADETEDHTDRKGEE